MSSSGLHLHGETKETVREEAAIILGIDDPAGFTAEYAGLDG